MGAFMQEAFLWEEAKTAQAREAVYRFRYTQYFSTHHSLPGTDQARGRVWLPHDDQSRHFLVRTQAGSIVAVATATPATEPSLFPEWQTLLELERLHAILPETMIVSRAIVAKTERHSTLFGKICLRLAARFLNEGRHYAVHYCAPGRIFLYERLGYRLYGRGKNLRSGLFRLPMLLVADDMPYFQKVRSPFRTLRRDPEKNRPWIEKAFALCPELARLPFCLHSQAEIATMLASCQIPEHNSRGLAQSLRRGARFCLQKGDVLAPAKVDEGNFFVLSGSLSCGEQCYQRGDLLRTGAGRVWAKSETELVSV